MAEKSPKKKAADFHTTSPLWKLVDARCQKEVLARKPKPADIERAGKIADVLAKEFPEAFCALHFTNAFELLIATILSAQCTDVRVNMVTPELFKKYPTPAHLMNSPEGELEKDIHSTGFFNAKAKAVRQTARQVVEEFGGVMPREIEKLTTLRGAGRKTANVVRMHAFGMPGISVDTHFTRIMGRLKLSTATDPEKIEFDAAALLPPERWTKFADTIILHGRKTCQARSPKCEVCPISTLCPSAFKVGEPEAPRKKRVA